MNFNEKVYALCKKVPKGYVTTYGEIAKALNSKGYRAVGNALRQNKHPETIPCYRVIKSNGEIGGYCGSDHKKINIKIKKLKSDGIKFDKNQGINLKKYFYKLK